jgi:hypothetical protein
LANHSLRLNASISTQGELPKWIFARDLLSRGIQGRQGVGDVQVRPSPGPAGGESGSVLNIELISPYGQARFETPAR